MTPLRLALRTVLLGRPRARLASLVVAATLCALDLFAGHLASQRARLEYQAVVGERLGHLALVPRGGAAHGFDAGVAARVKRIAEGVRGVALAVPQVNLTGVASSGRRSALFLGTGVAPPSAQRAPGLAAEQPGKLQPDRRHGIAVSDGQARSLGIGYGSAVTLTGVAADAAPVPLKAQVVDIYRTSGLNADARTVLMPLEMAQDLLDTGRTERVVVFLSRPAELDARRAELAAAMRRGGVDVEIRSWRELSAPWAQAEWASGLEFACAASIALVLVWATLAVTLSVNAFERRRELAMLRALGMRRSRVFAMIAAEAVWMVAAGAALSLAASGLIAWIVNRVALSFATQPSLARPEVLVELDPGRIVAMLAAVLAAALLAALVPALRAAQADVARGLALGGHAGW